MRINKAVYKICFIGLLVSWVVPVHGQDNTEAQCGAYEALDSMDFSMDAVGVACLSDQESQSRDFRMVSSRAEVAAHAAIAENSMSKELFNSWAGFEARKHFRPCPDSCPAIFYSWGNCNTRTIQYGKPAANFSANFSAEGDFEQLCPYSNRENGKTYEEREEECKAMIEAGKKTLMCAAVRATITCSAWVGRRCGEGTSNYSNGKFATETNR